MIGLGGDVQAHPTGSGKKCTRSGHTKWAGQKIKTEISRQQRIGAQNLKKLVLQF